MLFTPLLYVAGFLLALLALVVWFYFRRNDDAAQWFQRLVFIGLALYLGGLFMSSGAADFKIGTLARDLTLIGAAGLLFNFLIRKRPAFFFGLVAILVLAFWYYQNVLKPTAQVLGAERTAAELIELDPDGELLVELNAPEAIEPFRQEMFMRGLSVEPAFRMDHPERTDLDQYFVIDLPGQRYDADQIAAILANLQDIPNVVWLEPNEVIRLDDPGLASGELRLRDELRGRYGINDPGLEELWAFDAMAMDQLYAYLRSARIEPEREALVAILDTGVDAAHEDIRDNFRSIRSRHDKDPHRHGTHCAGIAASVSNNGRGIASYSPDNSLVRVSSVRVLSPIGSGTQRGIINGILEASDKGADVISMSLGGRSNQSAQRAYEKAVRYATDANAIVVAAAGNSNRNAKDFSPVNVKGVLGVSALGPDLNRAIFSNTVQDIDLAVAAPGVDILSTIPGDKYAKFSGTSMATPYVAGLAGLLKAINPDLTTEELYELLDQTGKATGSTRETGRLIQPLNAVRALLED